MAVQHIPTRNKTLAGLWTIHLCTLVEVKGQKLLHMTLQTFIPVFHGFYFRSLAQLAVGVT